MTFDPPEIEWPDRARGSIRFDEAMIVSNALSDDVGLAYIHAALVSEQEVDSGLGGSPLHDASQVFMSSLALLALP